MQSAVKSWRIVCSTRIYGAMLKPPSLPLSNAFVLGHLWCFRQIKEKERMMMQLPPHAVPGHFWFMPQWWKGRERLTNYVNRLVLPCGLRDSIFDIDWYFVRKVESFSRYPRLKCLIVQLSLTVGVNSVKKCILIITFSRTYVKSI